MFPQHCLSAMPAAIFRLILCISFLGVTAIATTSTPPENNTTKTIAFSSAVQLATSVQWQLDQLATIPAIPMPKNVTSLPAYQAVSKLAPALPVIQAGVELPDAESMISDLISWNNVSSTGDSLAARQNTLRVLIVGDSMTQGQQGDYTWRYRIWEWFQDNQVSVQFVGPYSGTVPPNPASPPSPPPLYGATAQTTQVGTNGSYAKDVDSAFLSNSNHFAVWGRAAAVDKGLIGGVLQQNPADLMLLMLGFNDMGWFYSDAAGTIDSISTLVSNARAVNPNLKFAIANVPQRNFIGGRQDLVDNTNTYNQLLPAAISQWSTEQSPIQLVELQQNYDCQPSGCPAGYDGLHPNAWGEYLIAQAFAQTLVDGFSIGSEHLAIPNEEDASLDRDLPVPTNFQVFTSPQGVSATWDEVYGAYSYDVSVSINDGANTFSPTTTSFNRWDCQWPLDGWTYAVSVRASAGDNRKGDYTATLSAVAHPQLAAPPENVVVTPTETGFTVTWDPPTGDYTGNIVIYNVLYWDWNPTDCQYISGAAFKSSPAVIERLNPGTNYLIAPVTWNENGQGLPFAALNAVPGVGTPAVPGAPSVNSNDPTTVHITWEGSSLAGGYQVWSKNINQAGSEWKVIANVTESTCNDEYFLFPGVWNYAFALSAFNGNEESEMGPSSVAPSPASSITEGSPGPTCPAAASWCPGGASVSVPPVSGGGGGSDTITVVGGSTVTIGGTKTVIGGTTETLVLTTGTNSVGSVYTGTITEGPTSTTSAIAGLKTYTTFPPGVSWSTTSVATNTHDSSGHPVLGPWPLCWFCPPGTHGIVLSGWPGPGVFPGGGPPAGLPTPFPPITIDPEGDPSYESSTEPTKSSTTKSSSCSAKTATNITYYVSYATDAAGSTIFTNTYSSYSSQITGCTVSGTVATSTTVAGYPYCTYGGCSNCNARRDAATATAVPTIRPPAARKSETDKLLQHARNLTMVERDIPNILDFENVSDLFDVVRKAGNTIVVDHPGRVSTGGTSSSQFRDFDASEFNVAVDGLSGCTSVVVVSRLGVFATHFWEGPGFLQDARFQTDVIDYLHNGDDSETGTLPLSALVGSDTFGDTETFKTQIFIMTPAIEELVITGDTLSPYKTLPQGDNPPPRFGPLQTENPDRLTPLNNLLGQLMPGVPISTFVYRVNDATDLAQGAYGALIVMYSNNQEFDPNTGDPLAAPQRAAWQCWMQGKLMGSDLWNATPEQTGTCAANQKRQDGSACSSPGSGSSPSSSSKSGSSSSSSSKHSPTVTTMYITKTTTFTTTIDTSVLEGALTVAGVSWLVFGAKGGELALSDYNLNYFPTQTTTPDPCDAAFFSVAGTASPAPDTWSDMPQSVSFDSPLTSGPTPLSSCIYTNPAAPNNGDGGTVSCQGTNFPCVIATDSVSGCRPDAAIGYDTSILPIVSCDVYVATTTVATSTSTVVQTITSTIS